MKATDKLINHRGNSVITIEILPNYSRPVVVKQLSEKQALRESKGSLEREYEMTRSLESVEGVRKVLGKQQTEGRQALILEYIDGRTLQDHISGNKLDIRSKLKIAIDLALILGKIHKQKIIHLDINSNNILIDKKSRVLTLIDLASAKFIDRCGNLKVQPDQVLGSLSYISPEQTGRINRPLDERSDLYSMGIVLYELVTGQLPFDAPDPVDLVHCHIARLPSSPSEANSEIPDVFSAVILKLLSKNADDRYQSAAGVQADLEKCLSKLSGDNTIEKFSLGEIDYASCLRFPQKLYGREHDLKELEHAFESVCLGTASILFIGGYSGVGKTSLVEEIRRPVSEKSGYFIEGKFDQVVSTPYAGISQALAQFISQILAQTETRLAAWRAKILEAVGPNGRVLIDIVPSLELVIGPQAALQDLSGQEAQNRFNYVFQRFIGTIAHSEHPVCIFLDDLQWVDPGSLGLLKALFTSADPAHLIVVGAYRDNEVDKAHPLMTLIADLEKTEAKLKQMTLPKLTEADIETLISDALRRDTGEISELSRLIYKQTDGNPYFTRQVLNSLENQNFLTLNTANGRWHWDMDAIMDLDVAISVVELLVGRLKELPAHTVETIKVAACIGRQFDIDTLTLVREADKETILDHVQDAIAVGLIWERDDLGFFAHDRVQEAAYALVPIEERDRLHLTIGRLLLADTDDTDLEDQSFNIVTHYNKGANLLTDPAEKLELGRLNLQVAVAARHASAFETGLNYARAGIELLGEDAWERHYRLTLQLHEQAALLSYSVGDIPAMEQHSKQVLQFGRDPHDLGQIQRLHIEFLLSSKRFDEAIDFGLKALRTLGQEFLPEPDWAFTTAKLSEFLEHLEQRPPDYVSIPRLYDQDPELLSISDILFSLGSAAYIYRPAMAPLMYLRSLELSLEHQLLSDHTPTLIIGVGIFANALLGKVELAHTYGEVAMELASRAAFQIDLNTVLHIHALHIHFWRKPLRETLGFFDRAVQSAHDFGSNEYASYARHGWSKHAVYASIELAQVEESSLKRRTFLDAIQNVTVGRWINIYVTAVQALRGNSSAQGITWSGTPFDDDRDLPDLQRVGDKNGLLYVYCAKAWIATLFGDHSGVKEYSDLSHSFIMASPTGVEKAILTFVCGLRHARELRVTSENTESEQALQEQLDLLEGFAGLAPMNFSHKLSLVQAEAHRAHGEVFQAMQSYEKASQDARDNNYLNEAGLAHAFAAEFFQDLGLHQAALYNLEQAAKSWRSWGAHALVERLSQRFADLPGSSDLSWESSSDSDVHFAPLTQAITPFQLDMESIISASQMLSAETDLEQLLTKMIALVMANSGAEKAMLLLRQDNDWFVQARGDSSSEKYEIMLNLPLDPGDSETDFIPESIFNYCQRSKEVLVVGNAKLDQRFSQDRTIRKHHVLSLACFPVLKQGELKAMLYLENYQLAHVFTMERQQVMRHLSTQFGISVENAMLYDGLNTKTRELEVSETRFRSLVENAEEAIAVSQDNLVKYANVKIQEILGYSLEEIMKLEFEKFIHPDDLNTALSEYRNRLSGEKPASKYSIRIISKQGQTKYVYVKSALIDWDGRPATLALISDITQLKKVESELRISKERYQLAVKGSDAGIWDYNISTGEIYYSDRFKELMGYEPHEMNDHTPEQSWDNLHPDFREIAPLKLNQHLKKETPYYEIDYLVKTKSGEYRWFQARGKAVSDENGNPIRVAGSFIDIHDRKNKEEEIRQAYDEIKVLKDQLQAESEYLQQEIKLEHNFESIIGQSEALKYVLSRVEKVAPTDFPALIMGETGTGKELIARAIHQLSQRSKRAMVKVNCAALPAELIESELFGREKGAYTGASTAQAGRFELASGSTLFLDEIGELPLKLQAKLLRVLESGEFERLGSSRTLHSDARIIAATNRELEEEVSKGHFRDDLWYRIKVFPITVPPLRERPEDIPLLFQSFLEELCRKMGKSLPKISSRDMQLLQTYPWPGNVRELRHSIESALINAEGNRLTFELSKVANSEQTEFKSYDDMERDYILRVLKAKQWRIGGSNGAASALDLNVNTLRGKMTKLGIKKPPSK